MPCRRFAASMCRSVVALLLPLAACAVIALEARVRGVDDVHVALRAKLHGENRTPGAAPDTWYTVQLES